MSEKEPNNPQYLEHHPDAVQDSGKAEFMARAGDENRTDAAVSKQKARNIVEIFNGADYAEKLEKVDREEFGHIMDALLRGDITQESAFDAATSLFEYNRAATSIAKRAMKIRGRDLNIAGAEWYANGAAQGEEFADKKEAAAAADYDKFYK